MDSAWNVDLQEVDYNPSKKDLTDAKIHHLLDAEFCQSPKMTSEVVQQRRLSYSRHVVEESDLVQEIKKTNSSFKHSAGGESRRHHHRRSRRSGRINHVTFPTTEQFSNEFPERVNEKIRDSEHDHNDNDEWDAGITFTVNPRTQMEKMQNSFMHKQNFVNEKKIADIHLPWNRFGNNDEAEGTITPIQMKYPWCRGEDESELDNEITNKREYPYWKKSKEYLPYSSHSYSKIGKINERPKLSSVLNLFRKDRSRCSITRLESNDSLHDKISSTEVRNKDYSTSNIFASYLSPSRDANTSIRRGSMLELGAVKNKVSDEDFLAVSQTKYADGSPRFRSGSMFIPRRRDGFITISSKPSSSSSSSDSDGSLG